MGSRRKYSGGGWEYVRARMLQKQIGAKSASDDGVAGLEEMRDQLYTVAIGRIDLSALSIVDIGNWPVVGIRDGN